MAIAIGSITLSACTEKPTEVAVTSVSISESIIELTEGDSFTLTASILPENASDKSIIWASSDEKVASVVNGKVSAIAPGNANITATASGKSASCMVTVKSKEIVAEGVVVSPTQASVVEGKTIQLSAKIYPDGVDQSIEWASDNKDVATVDANGLVTAHAPGNVKIVARSVKNTTMQAYCMIEVTQDKSVKGIAMNPSEATIRTGKTKTLSVVFTPEYAENKKLSWSSDNTKVATVSDGVVTAVANGTATITAISEDGGYTATCQVTVSDTGSISYHWTQRINSKYIHYFINGEDANDGQSIDWYDFRFYDGDMYYRGRDDKGYICMMKNGEVLFQLYKESSSGQHYWGEEMYQIEDCQINEHGIYFFLTYFNEKNAIYHMTWDGELTKIDIPGCYLKMRSAEMAIAPNGDAHVVCSIEDTFHEKYLAHYTVSLDGTVKEKLIQKGDVQSPSICFDKNGDCYILDVLFFAGVYDVILYKNDEKDKVLDRIGYGFCGEVRYFGGSIYYVVSNVENNVIKFYKDNELIMTCNDMCYYGNSIRFSSNGDIYYIGLTGWLEYSIRKNDQTIYIINGSMFEFDIVED